MMNPHSFLSPGSRTIINHATFINNHAYRGNIQNGLCIPNETGPGGQQINLHILNCPVLKLLYDKSSPAAAYNSRDRYDPPKCHPDTRQRFLNDVRLWA
ncbi:hypothetical protein BJ165DRAFT_1496243 [Panaeolus papilionaceus]|nr:hypothetical protein BJ165DRAFT_1496243 [Panaeolus papilionaceus]